MGVYGSNFDFGMSPFFKDDGNIVGNSVTFDTIPLTLFLDIQTPSVFSFKDIDIDFTANPIYGSAPLVVQYNAIVTFRGNFANRLSVKEYHWYFDPVNNPDTYIVSTVPTINQVYVGTLGSLFSTKLTVILEPSYVNYITNWVIGTNATVTWNFPDVLSDVKIDLSRDFGNTWTTIIADTPNTGTYTWFVTGPISSSALVRVSGLIYTDPIDDSTIDFTDIVAISTFPFTIS